jgi:hypothetical protein
MLPLELLGDGARPILVEDSHHRPFGEHRRFLVDRHARRAIGTVRFQDAALLSGKCRSGREHSNQQPACRRKRANVLLHFRVPPFAYRETPGPFSVGSLA